MSEDETCSVQGCDRQRKYRLYCGLHYKRLAATGETGPPGRITQPAQGRVCDVEGCGADVRCRGLCGLHYSRMLTTGSTSDSPRRGCSVDGCDRPHLKHGYCNAHHLRVRSWGDPRAREPLRPLPKADERDDVVARILAQTRLDEHGCLLFEGVRSSAGYGTISWRGRSWPVHRAMWTILRGPLPDDPNLTLDHLCYRPNCVNVLHLDPASRSENTRRAAVRRAFLKAASE